MSVLHRDGEVEAGRGAKVQHDFEDFLFQLKMSIPRH